MNMLTSLSDKDRDILIRAYVIEFGGENFLKIKFGLHRIQETLNLFTVAVQPREWIMRFLKKKLTFGDLNIGDHFVAVHEPGGPIVSMTRTLTLNKKSKTEYESVVANGILNGTCEPDVEIELRP